MFNFCSVLKQRDYAFLKIFPSLSLSLETHDNVVKVFFSISSVTESRGTGSLFYLF